MGVVFGVIWAADCNNAIRFHFRLPAKGHPPPAVKLIFKRDERYIVVGVDFGVIWVADFKSAIRFYVRRPTCRPPSQQNIKKTTDISLWVSLLGLFGPLISIMQLDITSAVPAAGHTKILVTRCHTKILRKQQIYRYGFDFCVIVAADFNSAIRFYVRPPAASHPPSQQNS